MKLSDQAVGAVMMALQKSLMEQSDIVPTLKDFDFVVEGDNQTELVVTNPPTVKFDEPLSEEERTTTYEAELEVE
tara:strand:+ start:115 stop:339 length:225 start_codon:yes stop_codon:yes gene_type:complete